MTPTHRAPPSIELPESPEALLLGTEWIVDAHGCEPERLRSSPCLRRLFDRVVEDMDLHPMGDAVWHVFPGPGGITGVLILSESHLTCHTFPERGFAAFNLYSCRPRREWPWNERLKEELGAARVTVRAFSRGDVPAS